ncbi:MAG: aldehyde ferredoxin oxidoreductase N-terminal domain-containing protein [Thermodesulfobacteriota bacterium]|jgi:aldehyde:ferredoxin oxidoreductase
MSWAGTILRVDLTERRIEKEPTSRYVKDYIGNAAIAARIFWKEVPPETRPFDTRNILMFSTGPLTGTLLGNKATVASKTPVRANNPFAFVGIGGQLPSEIKFAGYDHIVIKGKAAKPVYLFINNNDVEIRDASHLWGLDVHETQQRIKEELGDPEVQVACIGLAGENLVVYALILHDIDNTASKKGFGAVMGSKNLKAIAVRGTRGLKVADPKEFLGLYDEFYGEITKGRATALAKMLHTEGISRQIAEGYRCAYGEEVPDELPLSPTKEWVSKYMAGPIGCAFCPIQCHQNFRVPGIGNGGTVCVNYFGLLLQFMYNATDFELWWKRTMLANRYGLDTLQIEMIGGWLMELYKRGIITAADTDGIPMERGSDEAITILIEKIAKREGFGELFANGIVQAAQEIGKGHLDLADQYNNEFPYGWNDYAPDLGPVAQYRAGDLERVPGYADAYGNIFSYADILGVSPREAQKLIDQWCNEASERLMGDPNLWRKPKYDKRIGPWIIEKETEFILGDITGHCEVMSPYLEHYGIKFGTTNDNARWLAAATGIKYTADELRETASRIRTLIDAYNVLCARMIGEKPVVAKPIESLVSFPQPGRPKGAELRMIQEDYCKIRGYDSKTGIPTRERLEKLGLKDVAERLGMPAKHA